MSVLHWIRASDCFQDETRGRIRERPPRNPGRETPGHASRDDDLDVLRILELRYELSVDLRLRGFPQELLDVGLRPAVPPDGTGMLGTDDQDRVAEPCVTIACDD